MNEEQAISFCKGVLIGVGILVIVAFVLFLSMGRMNEQITYVQCCGNQTCSDTYYDANTNLCHLSLCEQSVFTNKQDCVYEGANITFTAI